MRPKSLFAMLAAATAASLLAFPAAAAQPASVCLSFDDLEQIHMLSNNSALATTRRGAYMVTFRNGCQAMSSAAFFILHRVRLGVCLDAGDLLELSEPAPPCIVDSVTPVRSVPIRTGRE